MEDVVRRVVLASASKTRLEVLRAAGVEAEAVASGVDEEAVEAESVRELVEALAIGKAQAVAERVGEALVIGCDSLLELEGRGLGKPESADQVVRWWRERRGRRGTLYTGHCLIDTGSGRRVSAVGETAVRFGSPSDAEIRAYAASEEPLWAAGAFTIDGKGGWFVERIEGDAGNVLGLSLPLLRELLGELGISPSELWSR
ncbi:Maf family nucleotide pyrophosphatase [Actinocorallia sp. B10E7]|uniref:Maf family protein n=1 Tax=Actinocorallia sp. B10E7 TaxID=3153558 RepID=UPI00325E00B8